METWRDAREFILPIDTIELYRDKNYVIDSDIWPRNIPDISPWWELEYLSVAKILIVALRAD